MTGQILSFLIIFIALAGVILSTYIFQKKRRREHMVCPLKADCDSVIQSDYSKFLGIPLELIGIAYYSLIFFTYSLSLIFSSFLTPTISLFILGTTTTAFLFSIYLTFIQGFALKQWCSWCLVSALFSTTIFFIAVISSNFAFIELLAYNGGLFVFIHLTALSLGVGSVVIGDIFFLRSLKDFRISVDEANILRWFGQISWLSLAIITLTEIALYLPNIAIAEHSARWQAEFTILIILILNSAFFYLVISPKLVSLSFDKERLETKETNRFKKMAFAMASVSFVSWFSILILSSAITTSLGLGAILSWFVGATLLAVFISQVLENYIGNKAKRLGM